MSSTFRDMHAERDLLARRLFPAFRRRAEELGTRFADIDLRWGITEDEARAGRTLALCLREIDLCRPFFICMLGHRYGWISPENRAHLGILRPELGDFSDRSITELEIRHALLQPPAGAHPARALILFRDARLSRDLCQAHGCAREHYFDAPAGITQLDHLRQELERAGVAKILDYAALPQFEESIAAFLSGILADRESRGLAPRRGTHDGIRQLRAAAHVRRPRLEWKLPWATLVSPGAVLEGRPGTGKSSLLANFATDHVGRRARIVVYRDCEAVNQSAGWRGLLRDVANEIRTQLELPLCDEGRNISDAFRDALRTALKSKSVLIVLDNLDGLFEGNEDIDMSWLDVGGSKAKVLLSARTPDLIEALRRRRWKCVSVGALAAADRRRIAQSALDRYGKRLSRQQLATLIASPATGNAKFLHMALERLRQRSLFETLERDINQIVGSRDVRELTHFIIADARADDPENCPDLAATVLKYLVCSRRGLSDYEIRSLATLPRGSELPPLFWSALNAALTPLLVIRDGLWDFVGTDVRGEVARVIFSAPEDEQAVRKRMAAYFISASGPRQLDEYPWQLVQLADWNALAAWLRDPRRLGALWDRSPEETSHYVGKLVSSRPDLAVTEVMPSETQSMESPSALSARLHMLADFGAGDAADRFARRLLQAPSAALRRAALLLLVERAVRGGRGADATRLVHELDSSGLMRSGSDRLRLLLARSAASKLIDAPEQALAALVQLGREAREQGDDAMLALAYGNQAALLEMRNDAKGAARLYREQLSVARRSAVPAAVRQSLTGLARASRARGRTRDALRHLRRAEAYATRYSAGVDLAEIAYARAEILAQVGNFDGALEALDRQDNIGQQIKEPTISARSRLKQAELYLRLARPRAAEELARQVLELVAVANRPDLEELAHHVRALAAKGDSTPP